MDLTTQWGESDFNYGRKITNGGTPWAANPIWHDQSAITYGANWKTPILLNIGERDFRVPIGNTLENWSTIQRMQVPSRLLVWPDAWHWILKPEDSRHFYDEVANWLPSTSKASPRPEHRCDTASKRDSGRRSGQSRTSGLPRDPQGITRSPHVRRPILDWVARYLPLTTGGYG